MMTSLFYNKEKTWLVENPTNIMIVCFVTYIVGLMIAVVIHWCGGTDTSKHSKCLILFEEKHEPVRTRTLDRQISKRSANIANGYNQSIANKLIQ